MCSIANASKRKQVLVEHRYVVEGKPSIVPNSAEHKVYGSQHF